MSAVSQKLSSMQALAEEIAHYLGLDLGGIRIRRFADQEIYVQVQVLPCLPGWHFADTCLGLHNPCNHAPQAQPASCMQSLASHPPMGPYHVAGILQLYSRCPLLWAWQLLAVTCTWLLHLCAP